MQGQIENTRPRIAHVAIGTRTLDVNAARRDTRAVRERLGKLDAELWTVGDIVLTVEDGRETNVKLLAARPDLIVLQLGTWTHDTVAAALLEGYRGPLMVWATPEDIAHGKLEGGQLCGLLQSGGTLSKIGYKFIPLYGAPDDPDILGRIDVCVRALTARNVLRQARVALVGGPCPGMTDATFHELELRNVLGPQVVHIELEAFFHARQQATDEDARRLVDGELRLLGEVVEPREEDLLEAARTALAIEWLAVEHQASCVAVRCWPEMRERGVGSPCYALCRLSDQGVPAACEGDALAAISMLTLQTLTGQPAYLGDLLMLDKESNCAYEFHCGAAASKLAGTPVRLRMHAELASDTWKPGVTVEFAMRPGRVTYCRLGEVRGVYRLILMGGEALQSETFIRGSVAKVQWDAPVNHALEAMIVEGHEHHLLCAPGDVRQELIALGDLLGIRTVQIGD